MDVLIERGRTIPFDSLPPRSVALDGYVLGPHIDPEHDPRPRPLGPSAAQSFSTGA